MKKNTHGKTLIGWTEKIDFPDWKIKGLKAKIDTGARTSALHVEDIRPLPNRKVRFHVILDRKALHKRVSVTARVVKWAKVRSSNGEYSTRCFVRTRVRIGPVEKEIEITLISRHEMVFRMLLGRKAIEKEFIVDVSKKMVLDHKPPRKVVKKKLKRR